MPLHPSLLIVVISLRGQAAHFSPDRLPEGPDSRLGPDPQLLRQAFEERGSSVQAGDHHGKKCVVFEAGIFPLGQRRGWTRRNAVGGVRNHEPPGTRQASPKVADVTLASDRPVPRSVNSGLAWRLAWAGCQANTRAGVDRLSPSLFFPLGAGLFLLRWNCSYLRLTF
ncbi:hypothetical protein ACFX2J_007376 [Malus domestica]